jgi:hypothetical protein
VSPVRTRQLAVTGVEDVDGREVMVGRGRDDRVTVTWFCGDQRTFTVEGLADAIRFVERARAHDDVWVSLRDSRSREFFAKIDEDGQLRANTTPTGGNSVPWADLKKALKKMAKDDE